MNITRAIIEISIVLAEKKGKNPNNLKLAFLKKNMELVIQNLRVRLERRK